MAALLAEAGGRERRTPAPRDRAADPGFRVLNADGSADGGVAEVWLYEEIGGWWGLDAASFVDTINAISAPRIRLRINSPGGDVFDGIAIYQALLSHPATVDVQIDGLAASAASYVAQAGDTVSIGASAMMMIHDAWGFAVGDARDMRSLADLLDKISTAIADVYATRAGGSVDAWRTAMLAETWYTGREAVDAGLADTVLDAGKRKADPGQGDPSQGGSDPAPADRADPLHRAWDLSLFRYAGRSVAPAPKSCADPDPDPQAPVGAPTTPADTDPAPAAEDQDDDPAPDVDQTWADLTGQLATPEDPFASMTRGLLL